MKKNKFTVVVEDKNEVGYPIHDQEVLDSKSAKSLAEKLVVEYPCNAVYIEYFRYVDSQSGYLNRDGYSITGKDWGSFNVSI